MGEAKTKEIGKYSGRPLHVPRRMLTREVRPGYAFRCANGRMVLAGQTVPEGESIEGQEHKLMKVPSAPVRMGPAPDTEVPQERSVEEAPANRAIKGAPKAKRVRATRGRAAAAKAITKSE